VNSEEMLLPEGSDRGTLSRSQPGGRVTKIDTICVEIITKCPLRCVHCSASATPERGEIMSPSLFQDVASTLMRLKEVYISGGEPFEHPSLAEFVRVGRRYANFVAIYSSGTTLDAMGQVASISEERLVMALHAGLSRIDVSLYAARAADHDRITETPGSFERTLGTLRRLRLLGIPFGVHFVPIGDAGSQVLRTAELAREMGATRFHVLKLALQGRAYSGLLAELDPNVLGKLAALRKQVSGMEIVISSALRAALGAEAEVPTERDQRKAAMLDVAGFFYANEGRRLPAFRSKHSVKERSVREVLDELVG
jgi:MoaA/NifB/PqqE/SkfB family radical SAM enzyme